LQSSKTDAVGKMKILIVDDHQEMRELMRTYLPDTFDEIRECEDGIDALDCYREFLPDWVLMDWKTVRGWMPIRRLEDIQKRFVNIPPWTPSIESSLRRWAFAA
jgi:CheY-like chemotaxis protein